VGRDPLELADLVGSEAEDLEHGGIGAGDAAAEERRQDRVEPLLAAQDAGREFMTQAAVGVGESAEATVEGNIERHATPDLEQDPEGGAARGEAGIDQSSIPVVGLDGTATSRRGIRPAR
jgi:hypothetical protein